VPRGRLQRQGDEQQLRLHPAAAGRQTAGGTKYLGWTTKALQTNTAITVIHHPGTWKRISFGKVTQTSGNFWRVVYSQSSTEGGSSGSPLLNSSKQVVGQLYAGTALCTNMSGYDRFGKFSVSWTKGLSTYLNH
jgi:V8-like Glu-specific endopeptidase